MSRAKTLLMLPLRPGLFCAATASAQIRSAAITNFVPDQSGAAAPNAAVTNDVPTMTQNPLFFAMPQNGVQPRNENASSMTIGSIGRSK